MTCIFDLELTSMLPEGSTLSCHWASGDLLDTHASFHSEPQLSKDNVREVLDLRMFVRSCSDVRDRSFHWVDWQC